MKNSYFAILFFTVISCSLEDESAYVKLYSNEIIFGVESAAIEAGNTKGSMVEKASDMGSIGVFCANTYDGIWSATVDFNKMLNQKLYYNEADENWVYDDRAVEWDEDVEVDNYTFFAYSPYSSSTNGVEAVIENGELMVSYTMPESCVDQPDLMLAVPRKDIKASLSGSVTLSFKHALASIGFSVIGVEEEVIKSVTLRGVIASGEVSIDDKGVIGWKNLAQRDDIYYSAEIDRDIEPDIYLASNLTLDDGYLMMIPQEVDDVEVEVVTYNSDSRERLTHLFNFAQGTKWEVGEFYQYTINLSSYDYTIEGTSNCYMLHPTGDEQIFYIPVEGRINSFWRDYADDNQTYKDMLSSSDVWNTRILWHDIDGGLDGFSARRVVSGFSPSEEVTPFSAPDFTTIGTRSAMEITLPENIDEGNILIGVEFDGEILWSWHFWITDYNPDLIAQSSSPVSNQYSYTISGVDGAIHRYEDNELWGRGGIYQDKFIMDRNIGSFSDRHPDNRRGVLHYQFGRKDPFPAADLSEGEVIVNKDNVQVSFMTAVRNPTTFYTEENSPYSWSDEGLIYSAKYLWDDKRVDNNSPVTSYEKPFFDPSPLGWKLPIYGTYTVLDNNNCSESSSRDELVYNKEVYFPFSGYRSNNSGDVNDYGSQGNLRLATAYDESFGYNLAYSTTIIETNNTRSDGFSVRAIKE